jgi:hypothetical protein
MKMWCWLNLRWVMLAVKRFPKLGYRWCLVRSATIGQVMFNSYADTRMGSLKAPLIQEETVIRL